MPFALSVLTHIFYQICDLEHDNLNRQFTEYYNHSLLVNLLNAIVNMLQDVCAMPHAINLPQIVMMST